MSTMHRTAGGLLAALTAAVLVAGCSTDTEGSAVPAPIPASEAPESFAQVIASSNVDAERYVYPVAEGESDHDQNWVDLFMPKGDHPDGSVPLVVLIHGGSWQSQIGADTFVTFARRLAERGLAVYNLEYRRLGSGGGYPQTFADVAAALDFAPQIGKANPAIDMKNAVVVGHSAGGQLAMWAGTRHKLDDDEVGAKPKYRPTSVVSLAGPLDMRTAVKLGDDRIVRALGGTPEEVPERYTSVDPIQNIDPSMPTIAMVGAKDRVVPPVVSRNYVDAATKAGGTANFVLLPDTNHVTIVDPAAPAFTRVLETISRAAHNAHHA
ncbi:alpha/beta fold hydrolase [Gordonia alkaliphila]|uniref:alpha/beta hydrolase family protein n=1 Tax=Gordonia alkaliphila TaxID=1053547 RepID=UPI001FF5BED5|nr:alpha/beta fold hydrolase [Gordonia alkaliphila]MCK0439805.1 alpha/beta fold hydrolase [Gordonia alkaliphila]